MTDIIEIDSFAYDVYLGLAGADLYLQAAVHATEWQSTSDDLTKAKALVTATRLLDRQRWKGDKSDASQPLAWPRTGTGIEGVEDDEVPLNIEQACAELANALVEGSDVQNEANQAQKLQSVKAGSVSLSWFRGAEGSAHRFPQIIHELLRDYLEGGTLSLDLISGSGLDAESITNEDFGFSQGL